MWNFFEVYEKSVDKTWKISLGMPKAGPFDFALKDLSLSSRHVRDWKIALE